MAAARRSVWWWLLAACVGIRVAIPLAALAAEGRALPGLPAYDYGPFYGDANGYYATARQLIASAGRGALPLLAVLVAGVAVAELVRRRIGPWSWVMALVLGSVVSAATIVLVLEMEPTGIPAIGWPLLWAVPVAPLRVVGALNPDVAFAFGLFLSLVAIGCTVVATAFVGLWATGRRSVGMAAAVLFTIWPFVPGLVVGSQGWENGTWNVDTGLHLYAEPLSTALVVGALALLLREQGTNLTLAVAGLALGFGTVVKLTNGLIAAGVVVIVAWARGWRPAALLAGSSLVFAPVVITYWAKGFADTYDGAISSSNDIWSLGHVREAWGDSLLFTPALLLLLVPLAIVGATVVPARFPRALLLVPIVLTVLVYSVYKYTALHPRFFYVVLPQVLVLDAAGAVWIVCRARSGLANRSRSVNGPEGRRTAG